MSMTEVALYREKAMYGKEQRDFFEFARNIALAEEQKNTFELAKSYFIRGKIEEELVNDYIHAKDYYLIAYDSFIDANAYREAFKMMRRISDIDKKLDEESISIFSRKMRMH